VQVLVDTTIWSLALRAKTHLNDAESALADELGELIREGRVRLIGPIRQEVLSGIKEAAQFERVRKHLRAFPDEPLNVEDFEQAAESSNRCRSQGIAGSAVDFLICALALDRGWQIFTTDADFSNYVAALSIGLHAPRS
jgi:predicted nucleic acid-binding protein